MNTVKKNALILRNSTPPPQHHNYPQKKKKKALKSKSILSVLKLYNLNVRYCICWYKLTVDFCGSLVLGT